MRHDSILMTNRASHLLALTLVAASLLAGCGQAETSTPDEEASTPQPLPVVETAQPQIVPAVPIVESGMKFSTPELTGNYLEFSKFRYSGRRFIFADGVIRDDTAKKFRAFVAENGISSALVIFNSPGGSLDGGLTLGSAIRDLGFDTSIGQRDPNSPFLASYSGLCASACVYSYAGGVFRYVDNDKQVIGLHQFYSAENSNQADMGSTQVVSAALVSYLKMMGVDPILFSVASGARGDDLIVLPIEKSEELMLVNNGRLPTTGEIKIVGMTPYLRLEQHWQEGTSKVILGCIDRTITLQGAIVTTAVVSQQQFDASTTNYFEINNSLRLLQLFDKNGLVNLSDALWFERLLGPDELRVLAGASNIGMWIETGGDFRWGGELDLRQVNHQLVSFVQNCLYGPRLVEEASPTPIGPDASELNAPEVSSNQKLTVAALPAPPAPQALEFPHSAHLVDSSGRVIIQSGASVFSSNVDSVVAGTHVQASGTRGKWILVRLDDGRVGFVRLKQLQFE